MRDKHVILSNMRTLCLLLTVCPCNTFTDEHVDNVPWSLNGVDLAAYNFTRPPYNPLRYDRVLLFSFCMKVSMIS